jgi:hypothetical protein
VCLAAAALDLARCGIAMATAGHIAAPAGLVAAELATALTCGPRADATVADLDQAGRLC